MTVELLFFLLSNSVHTNTDQRVLQNNQMPTSNFHNGCFPTKTINVVKTFALQVIGCNRRRAITRFLVRYYQWTITARQSKCDSLHVIFTLPWPAVNGYRSKCGYQLTRGSRNRGRKSRSNDATFNRCFRFDVFVVNQWTPCAKQQCFHNDLGTVLNNRSNTLYLLKNNQGKCRDG